MELSGEYELPASKAEVWQALNDTEILKKCVPGCEAFERISDTEFAATALLKIGPVKARFKGKVQLSDIDPMNGYTIAGSGEGGVAGFAKGGAKVRLERVSDDITLLRYEVDATVGGKLAQIGQRLVMGSAKKLAAKFFTSFAEHFATDSNGDA